MRLPARFAAKFRLAGNGCWLWTAATDGDGYGRYGVDGANRKAHRVSYEFAFGSIPEGMTLDHRCRNRACVNPEHLEAVTLAENILRGTGPCAQNAQKTHCPEGHPLEPFPYKSKSPRRFCPICQRRRQRECMQRQRDRAKAVAS